MQGQAGPSWQDGADVWITCTYSSTVFEQRPERKRIFLVTRRGHYEPLVAFARGPAPG